MTRRLHPISLGVALCAALAACDSQPAPRGAPLRRSAPPRTLPLTRPERPMRADAAEAPARVRPLGETVRGAARAASATPQPAEESVRGAARAASSAPSSPSAEDRARGASPGPAPAGLRAALLERGREHERRGELEAAARAFGDLVDRDGGDGEALAELAWVRLRRGDLDGAEEAARRAVPAARFPQVRGAALYTLGKVQLRRGDTDEAEATFAESLRQRPSEATERELAALGLRAWARPSPRRMAGPLASLGEVCATQEAAACQPPPGQRDEGPHGYDCAPLPLPLAPSDGPALQLVVTRCRGARFALSSYHVVAETRRGLYVARAVHAHYDGDGAAHELRPLAVSRVEGSLLLRYEVRSRERAPRRSDTDEYALLIGEGPSGSPSSTPPILVRARSVLGEGAGGARELQAELPLTVAPGAVVLGAPRLRGEGDEFFREHLAQRPSGRFPLSFP